MLFADGIHAAPHSGDPIEITTQSRPSGGP
jgi:hypothetical protein